MSLLPHLHSITGNMSNHVGYLQWRMMFVVKVCNEPMYFANFL